MSPFQDLPIGTGKNTKEVVWEDIFETAFNLNIGQTMRVYSLTLNTFG
jgi:hypothetical protein